MADAKNPSVVADGQLTRSRALLNVRYMTIAVVTAVPTCLCSHIKK